MLPVKSVVTHEKLLKPDATSIDDMPLYGGDINSLPSRIGEHANDITERNPVLFQGAVQKSTGANDESEIGISGEPGLNVPPCRGIKKNGFML